MTLNDLWARFKVIDSLNAAKMAKYSLVMTPTPCSGWMHYLLGVRIIGTRALTYLLTYTVGSGIIKPAISPKLLKIERTLLTAYIKLYTGFRCRQNAWVGKIVDFRHLSRRYLWNGARYGPSSYSALIGICIKTLSIGAKINDLEWPLARFKIIDSLNGTTISWSRLLQRSTTHARTKTATHSCRLVVDTETRISFLYARCRHTQPRCGVDPSECLTA